jgi:hypothetical protein
MMDSNRIFTLAKERIRQDMDGRVSATYVLDLLTSNTVNDLGETAQIGPSESLQQHGTSNFQEKQFRRAFV